MPRKVYAPLGQVTDGRLPAEDKLRAYADVADALWKRLVKADRCDEALAIDRVLGPIRGRLSQFYYTRQSATLAVDLCKLIELLEQYTPPFCRFGPRPGDDYCIGFWVDYEALDSGIRDGIIWDVATRDRWPETFPRDVQYVLVVRSWGHLTLYGRDKCPIWTTT